jgi:hypothetical protein
MRPRPGAKGYCQHYLKIWRPPSPTHEVRVTGVLDGHDTDSVELSGGGTEVDVGALVVVDGGLGADGRSE